MKPDTDGYGFIYRVRLENGKVLTHYEFLKADIIRSAHYVINRWHGSSIPNARRSENTFKAIPDELTRWSGWKTPTYRRVFLD